MQAYLFANRISFETCVPVDRKLATCLSDYWISQVTGALTQRDPQVNITF